MARQLTPPPPLNGTVIKWSGHFNFFSEMSFLDRALTMVQGPGWLSALAPLLLFFRPATNRPHCQILRPSCWKSRFCLRMNLDLQLGGPSVIFVTSVTSFLPSVTSITSVCYFCLYVCHVRPSVTPACTSVTSVRHICSVCLSPSLPQNL